MGKKFCCVCECKKESTYNLPHDEEVRKAWVSYIAERRPEYEIKNLQDCAMYTFLLISSTTMTAGKQKRQEEKQPGKCG